MLELAEIGKISIDAIKTGLSNYKNTKDEDIELFLSQKAIDFVKRKWCSVFLLINETELCSNHRLLIEWYFTLSIKSFRIGSTVSKNKKKRLFKGINTDCEDVPATSGNSLLVCKELLMENGAERVAMFASDKSL